MMVVVHGGLYAGVLEVQVSPVLVRGPARHRLRSLVVGRRSCIVEGWNHEERTQAVVREVQTHVQQL
jgi:hypothetical protein